LEGALKQWDDSQPFSENVKQFGWVPGVAYRPQREAQLREILQGHPRGEEVVEAIKEVHGWLSQGGCLAATGAGVKDGLQAQLLPSLMGVDATEVEEWATAYDLQPDRPFPERG
jgi:hypothetical protein